jgi:hypothetical protein
MAARMEREVGGGTVRRVSSGGLVEAGRGLDAGRGGGLDLVGVVVTESGRADRERERGGEGIGTLMSDISSTILFFLFRRIFEGSAVVVLD